MKNNTLLKKLACVAGFALLVAGNAQAAMVVNFNFARPNFVNIDNGTLDTITVPGQGAVIASLSYTVSGLTIDTDGVLNDTITVTAPISGFGPTANNNITFDPGSVNELDHNGNTFSNGEGISYGAITVSGTSSGGLAYQLDSALYTNFQIRRFAGTDAVTVVGDVSGTIFATDANTTGDNVPLADTVFTATTTNGTNNVNSVSFAVDVSTVAVPEPSSMALFAAGMGLFVTRRRRNKLSCE